jgi:predicted nucleotidyltransferase component of viral defense system
MLPPARYSEDIDLVQIRPEPIGPTIDLIRSTLGPWLGEPGRHFKEGRVTLRFRFQSEDTPPLKLGLKIEINSREHFTELGHERIRARVDSRWFSGEADVTTFTLPELLGTKLRALYQRKKGRDLFDLWFALEQEAAPRVDLILRCFKRCMYEGGHSVSRAQFEKNLHGKERDPDFRADVLPLLRPGIEWDFDDAMSLVKRRIIDALPGDPWAGIKA